MELNDHKIIQMILKQNNGFITSRQVTDAGLQRRALSELVASNFICRVGRGIYTIPEVWEDEMYFLQYRFSKGVFSNETALYLHGFSDRTPQTYTLTFPHGYNAAGLKTYTAKARFVSPEIYNIGVMEKPSPCGNPLCVYNIERTLCDIVKGGASCDIQLVNQAMKAYADSKTKDISKLISYSEFLRVKPKILRYMEVLL